MFRIAHISDLHLEDSQVRNEIPSLIQRLTKVLRKALFSTEINAQGHNPDKLKALQTVFRSLQPDLILVTGDLTNFGDKGSLKLAHEVLDDLKAVAKAEQVICVPGNHDCLIERVKYFCKTCKGKILIRSLAKFISEVEMLMHISARISNKLEKEADSVLLEQYRDIMEPHYGEVNPRSPVFLPIGWGEIAFFLFNSTNDLGLMVNEGRIGQQQFDDLNKYLESKENKKKFSCAVRIALLHHHPISAPRAQATGLIRGYNWMKDGPRFLDYMNYHKFHFVLHGHEHEPFQCNVNYGYGAQGVHIVASGSALQGDDPDTGSFNVIDILTPFEAKLYRYNYSPTGYHRSSDLDLLLPIKALNEIRLSPPGDPLKPEDVAIRNLFKVNPKAYDENHRYKVLDFEVEITEDQLYKGKYSRKGMVEGEEHDEGITFILTGSPGMKLEEMDLSAKDNINDSELTISDPPVLDKPNQKIIRVLHKLELKPASKFDITLNFKWQASDAEPNDFDGINLMYFKYPVGCLMYRVRLPWRPAQPKVRAYGIKEFRPELSEQEFDPEGDGNYIYSFKIKNPRPLAYLIYFEPARC